MRFWLAISLLTIIHLTVSAQKDDTVTVKKYKGTSTLKLSKPSEYQVKLNRPDSSHSQHKAIMRSLIIPGWGQAYNHKVWKVPIIYGGFTALGLAIQYNLKYYNIYLKEALLRQNSPTATGSAEFSQIGGGAQPFFSAADANRRNYQLSILGVVGVWGLNCLDAYIDANFKHSYSVDNNFGFKATPTLISAPAYVVNNYALLPAIKLTFTLN